MQLTEHRVVNAIIIFSSEPLLVHQHKVQVHQFLQSYRKMLFFVKRY